MNLRLILSIVLLVVALLLIILLWPRPAVKDIEVVKVPTQIASPTQVPPLPSPTPTAEAARVPATAAEPTEVPAEPQPVAEESPTPQFDEIDALFADLAPAVVSKNKKRAMEVLDALAAAGNRSIEPLADLMNNAPDENVREYAAFGLAKIGTPEAVNELLDAIRNEKDERLKENLRALLRRTRNPGIVDTAFEGLLQDEENWWSKDAAGILGSIGTPKVVSRLVNTAGSVEGEYQARIASSLARIRNEDAIPALGESLSNDAPPVIVEGLSSALAGMGTPEATEALLNAVRDTTDQQKLESMWLAFRQLTNKEAVPLLDKALDDEDSNVRAAAANALGHFENEPILAHLRAAYERESDVSVREAIERAIQRLGSRAM